MILLLGGTSESALITRNLALLGLRVMVSTMTDLPLDLPCHSLINRRSGPLDAACMADYIITHGIRLVIDATHPYAVQAHKNARNAAATTGVPCLRYERPSIGDLPDTVTIAHSHHDAALLACLPGEVVMLTVGSRNIMVYATQARLVGCSLFARVLDCPDSQNACLDAGMAQNHIIAARGPFSFEDNLTLFKRVGASVVVMKDSGEAGGVMEKVLAAQASGCRAILVARPRSGNPDALSSIPALIEATSRALRSENDLQLPLSPDSPPCTIGLGNDEST